MCTNNKITSRIRYVFRMLKILAKVDRSFLFTSIIEIFIVSVQPFVSMYLLSYAVNALSVGTAFLQYAYSVGVFLLVWLLLGITHVFISNYNTIRGNVIGQGLYAEILEKSLNLDYEMLLDAKVLEKKEMATKALAGGSFTALIVNFKNIVASFIVVLGVLTVVSTVDVWVLLISLLIVVAEGWLAYISKKQQYDATEELTPVNRKIDYYINLSTDHSMAKEIRLFHMKDALLVRYNELYNETLGVLKKVYNLDRNTHCGRMGMQILLESSIYLILGYKMIAGGLIRIGDFTLYGNAIRQFKDSMSNLLASFADVDNNGRYLQDYFEFLEIPSVFKTASGPMPTAENITIRFENVSYKYPNQEEYALQNINLTITDKMCVSLVGENGSGKTTFIKLLLRLCDPTEGNIYFNGVNIKEIEYSEYLKVFSVVFQDFNVFDFTIRDNITMLDSQSSCETERLRSVVEKVGLISRIDREPRGFDTYIGYVYDEKGIQLSGGEAQKLATARALYKEGSIVVLDEPTAALDPRAEFEVFSNFKQLTNGRVSVYISHRLSSCCFADCIVVLKDGQLIEMGAHDELLTKNGLYAELYKMQAKYYSHSAPV